MEFKPVLVDAANGSSIVNDNLLGGILVCICSIILKCTIDIPVGFGIYLFE